MNGTNNDIDKAIMDQLLARDEDFEAEPEATDYGTSVPDGDYLAKITQVSLQQTDAGDTFIRWVFRVLQGDYTGGRIEHTNWLNRRQNYGFLKRDLRVCGVSLQKLSHLPKHIERLHGLILEVNTKTTESASGKEYKNTKILRLASSGEAELVDDDINF